LDVYRRVLGSSDQGADAPIGKRRGLGQRLGRSG
jgi:hypothetical protein